MPMRTTCGAIRAQSDIAECPQTTPSRPPPAAAGVDPFCGHSTRYPAYGTETPGDLTPYEIFRRVRSRVRS